MVEVSVWYKNIRDDDGNDHNSSDSTHSIWMSSSLWLLSRRSILRASHGHVNLERELLDLALFSFTSIFSLLNL
jgi:hypothetical protein